MATLSEIPQPPTIPFLGNAALINLEVPIKSFHLLAKQYGEIYQMVFSSGDTILHINSAALVRQVSDDTKYRKTLSRSLREVRNLVGDGLFTAELEETNWGVAHRVLMPAFGTANVRTMFDGMKDICDQLLLKWARFGPEHVFDPSEDYTRLTFDTIALCSMSYRFNSFYEREMPPFTHEMVEFLQACNRRAFRPGILTMIPLWYKTEDEKYFEGAKHMTDLAREIIKKRRENPDEARDLLTLMLEGKDPKTGQHLPEENIIYNLLTFLIAGHETTSGMLTFATYYLLKNPACLQKLREELDSVVGSGDVTLEDLGRLPYLTAVMRETLRLSPTAPARTVAPYEDSFLIGGDGDPNNPENKKYPVKKDQRIVVHGSNAMRDPRIWGPDADEFRPERMLDGGFESLPNQAWQPFGFGLRGCIGRPFAWQEAQLVLASAFLKFDLYLADPSYDLQIKQALTIKPKDMMIRVIPRAGALIGSSVPKPFKSVTGSRISAISTSEETESDQDKAKQRLYVFYGSNTGTSESFAQRIASDAHAHGFNASLSTLDSAAGRLPTDGPVIIVTASFEGEPADNAAQFVAWLTSQSGSLKGVSYTVFGCGNREWARTFQRIPTLIDDRLSGAGAERILERGSGDAAAADFFQVFDEYEDKLWNVLEEKYGVFGHEGAAEEGLKVEFTGGVGRAKILRQMDAAVGEVLVNRVLTKEGAPEKRHIEIALPEGTTYRTGDYLAILPSNQEETVKKALARFKLTGEEEITINANGPTTLPVNTPTSVLSVLNGFVELGQPATTRDLASLKSSAKNEATISTLSSLLENYQNEILAKRISLLDLLETYPDIDISLSTFLNLLPPMRIRQYSIASSPLADPSRVALCVSVLDAPALSDNGRTGRRFRGVASTFLASLSPGAKVPVAVRPSGVLFSLPADPSVPIVMFCAGSGLAPFRGFVQERAVQKASGRKVGRAVLFFGCREPEEDYLYTGIGQDGIDTDIKRWIEEGVVEIRPAFSRKSDASDGCKYVQDRIWNDRQIIKETFAESAKFFTCGSRKVANGIKEACMNIMKDDHPQWSDDDAAAAFERVQKERYAADVFD